MCAQYFTPCICCPSFRASSAFLAWQWPLHLCLWMHSVSLPGVKGLPWPCGRGLVSRRAFASSASHAEPIPQVRSTAWNHPSTFFLRIVLLENRTPVCSSYRNNKILMLFYLNATRQRVTKSHEKEFNCPLTFPVPPAQNSPH